MRALTAAFLGGFGLLLVEMSGSRMIAPYLGNSIYTWTAAITVIFAGSAAGYYYGPRMMEGRSPESALSDTALRASICILLCVPIFALISPFFPFLVPGLSHLSGALALALPSFFLGALVTEAAALRAKVSRPEEAGGEVFAVSTAGSILGAIAGGFLLIPSLPLAYVIAFSALLMLVSSWLCAGFRPIELLPFGFLAAMAVFMMPVPFSDSEILFQEQSAYQLVTVARTGYGGQNTTVLILDALVESWEYDNGSMVYDYGERGRGAYEMLGREPRKALVIGAGAGSQLEQLKRDFPLIEVDGIEIDSKVVRAGEDYFSLREDGRTKIIVDDGRRGLERLSGPYDIVLVDVFRGPSAPPHLVTREFFRQVKEKMSRDGILMMTIASNTEGSNSEFFRLLHATLESEFGGVAAMPQKMDGQRFIRQTILLVATDSDMTRFRELNRERIYEPAPAGGRVLTDEWSPVDVLNPV